MNVYLESHGCRVNEAERTGWLLGLSQRGHRVVAGPADAHVVVLNTCAVTAEAARKARKRIARLKAEHPDALAVITGCWATLEPDQVGADLLIPNTHKHTLVEQIEALEPSDRTLSAEPILAAPRTRAFVKVQDGCRNRCTFCVVTIARGEERSREAGEILEEIHAALSRGVKEVVLTGIHLGGYGSDLGTDLYSLVGEILRSSDVPRLRLSSLEPWELHPEFFELWQDDRLCPHLHLPLQSGSDNLLRRMGRRNTVAEFKTLVAEARATIPGLTFTTDVIAGFPGETQSEAASTLALMEELRPADLHVFTYSGRPGTAAVRLAGQLDARIKRSRSRTLRQLAQRLRGLTFSQSTNQTRPVLWERRPSVALQGRLKWRGHTDNYLRVVTETDMAVRLGNEITAVRLITATDDETALVGEVVRNEIGPQDVGR